ncbi:MAG: hypothetical protein EXR02_02595 [Rhodospirillales bacterium]|nr:hypothetical protein [Rhodospirillales bacterium]MSP79938.1 hypothetical protein [Rhodospirillales bacterium]
MRVSSLCPLRPGLVLRLALVLPLAGLISACQTDGGLQGLFAPSAGAEASAKDGTPAISQQVSLAFYLPFYDQGDHLESLVKDSRFEDAAQLYAEQREFFTRSEDAAKHAPALRHRP